MIPYTNRLQDARFNWAGSTHHVKAVPGQAHGLHGMGHRQCWRVAAQATGHIEMQWAHTADDLEWPWSFSARVRYGLSAQGLQVLIEVRNNSQSSMPAILGWHPYVPDYWLKTKQASGFAAAIHDLGPDGLRYPKRAPAIKSAAQVHINLSTAHTLVLEQWAPSWVLEGPYGEHWHMTSDAAHLVHHMPDDLRYACVEPVTALPGILRASPDEFLASSIAIKLHARRQLSCFLGVES